ncbi:MAG: hypothetical protein EA377_04575 [Phycisphaerales bacterium]|nr:MAG: hypothetical protein EA377_04575 [Phycisphaerales bacterium]
MSEDRHRKNIPGFMATCVSLLFILALAMPASAMPVTSDAAENRDERSVAPPEPTLPPAGAHGDQSEVHAPQRMLLREGSVATQVRGRVTQSEMTGRWHFEIDAPDSELPVYSLILLPNIYLGEMQQVLTGAGGQEIIFEITGEITVYDQENYLLVHAPPRVISHATPRAQDRDREARPRSDREGQRSAEELMREMRERAGETARRPEIEAGTMAHDERLVPEGTLVLYRRVRLARGAGGAWRVVFEADASGQSDPPMTLLPCLLLERLEARARRTGGREPLLISGRVTSYNGRNYLLPTSFHLPRNRTELMP